MLLHRLTYVAWTQVQMSDIGMNLSTGRLQIVKSTFDKGHVYGTLTIPFTL